MPDPLVDVNCRHRRNHNLEVGNHVSIPFPSSLPVSRTSPSPLPRSDLPFTGQRAFRIFYA